MQRLDDDRNFARAEKLPTARQKAVCNALRTGLTNALLQQAQEEKDEQKRHSVSTFYGIERVSISTKSAFARFCGQKSVSDLSGKKRKKKKADGKQSRTSKKH